MTTDDFDLDFPLSKSSSPCDGADQPLLEIPLEEPASQEPGSQAPEIVAHAIADMTTADLLRDRRSTKIELAHIVEDLAGRATFLVLQLPARVWPGKNEEARAISKAAALSSDKICRDLERRRRATETDLAILEGEIDAREERDAQRKLAQKDLELEFTKRDLALRSRFADLDAQLRAAELIVANREAPEAQRERERDERVKLVAQYLK